ncbi:MAG: hypothetical protein PUB20_08790 [Clostridia bacterium]|nr:hypothetical protein [Clostridia bacterium]
MDSNKAEKLNKIDELLELTSSENRKKNKLSDDIGKQLYDNASDIEDTDTVTVEESPKQSKEVESDRSQLRIIDETSTVFVDDSDEIETPDITIEDSVEPEEKDDSKSKKKKKSKKTKRKKVKFSVWQWIIMIVCSVITLWFVIFTVDYTLASTGNSPLFSFETQSFEDGSRSYMGAGYKIQFFFEKDGTLYKNVVPFWKDGPNDKASQSNDDSNESNSQYESDNEVSFE